MKKFFSLIISAAALIVAASCSGTGYGYDIKDGVAVYNTPARPADQISMIGFAADPIDTLRVGFIGLGMRGPDAVYRFLHIDGVQVKALCDLYPERVSRTQTMLTGRGLEPAAEYSGEDGWKELCERDDIDLVYIATPWLTHTPMAVYAMEHGKHVAIEVPQPSA